MSFSRCLFLATPVALLVSSAVFAQATPTAPADNTAIPSIIAPAATAPVTNNPGSPVTREELPALVKEIIMNEPELIMEAAKKLREKHEAEGKKQASDALQKYKNDLFANPELPSVGAKDADVIIVEFFDYHCGYCKHMLPVLNETLDKDKKVRFVFVEFPILSDDSVTASRAALAVNRIAKDKYFDYHSALMKASGKFDEKFLMEAAKKLGIDTKKLKEEMAKPEITAALDKNREMAGALNISGTPALILGDEIMGGAVDYDTLKKVIDAVRAGKKPSEAMKSMEPVDNKAPAAEAPKN